MKPKAIITPEERRRGGFNIMTRRSQLEAATVLTIGAVAVGLLIGASRESRQDYNEQKERGVPAGTVDYYPGDNDAQQIIDDLALENDPKLTTYVVDTSSRTHAK